MGKKINKNAETKSKLNLTANKQINHNKSFQNNNKQLKKLSKNVKLTVKSGTINVDPVPSRKPENGGHGDGNNNKFGGPSQNKKTSIDLLFRQPKSTHINNIQSNTKPLKNVVKNNPKVNVPVPDIKSSKKKKNKTVIKPSQTTASSNGKNGVEISKITASAPGTSNGNGKPRKQDKLVKVSKINASDPTSRNGKPLKSEKPLNQMRKSNQSNLITCNVKASKQENPPSLVKVPKIKRKSKFYENGWIVEELNDNGNVTEEESSNSDRDSYIDKFFDKNDDDDRKHMHPPKKNRKLLKPSKNMLLVSQPADESDSSDSSPKNFIKLRTSPRKNINEQSITEIVPYVSANGNDEITSDESDSEYDPKWEGEQESLVEYYGESDDSDQYEFMDDEDLYISGEDDDDDMGEHNSFFEYSAEEVESDGLSIDNESFDSDDYSDEYDEDLDGWSASDDDDTYNSEDDEDYIPSVNDDLYIKRGEAKIYDVNDTNISFNSDEGAQIFEITDTEKPVSDTESCPDLVPITSSPAIGISKQNQKVNLNCSVVDEILNSDSENEKFENEDNDDDFLSNISMYQSTNNVEPMELCSSTLDDEPDQTFPDEKSKFYNSIVSSQIVLLHLKETLYFHGNFKVTLLYGEAESFGYDFILHKPIELYSPSCDSLLYLKPIESNSTVKFSTNTLEQYFTRDVLDEIKKKTENSVDSAVLLLEYWESKRVESIRLYMRDDIFPDVHEGQVSRPFHSSEIRLKTNIIFADSKYYAAYRKLEPLKSWHKIAMQTDSKIMVIGGKNVGKSTLIKYLINSNINRVKKILFIDFDIGQSEIYIPQTISATVIDFPILGSGCLHRVQPKKVLLFGDISVTSDQIKYIKACNTLIQYCTSNEELSGMPWVINTMGYNKGLGDEIIAAYLKTIKPTDVVQINSCRNADNFNQLFTPQFTNQFQFNMFTEEFKDNHEICSHNLIAIEAFAQMYERNLKGVLPPKDKRLMMLIAHLGDILDENESDAKWLTDAITKKIKLKDLHLFTSYNLDNFGYTSNLLKAALDSAFVYLCNKNSDPSTDATADCIGIGIVRHVDHENEILYLITAVSNDELELVNALALTNITIPKAILEKQSTLVTGDIKGIGLADNFIGTRHVQPQTYRPDTTVKTRSNFVKVDEDK